MGNCVGMSSAQSKEWVRNTIRRSFRKSFRRSRNDLDTPASSDTAPMQTEARKVSYEANERTAISRSSERASNRRVDNVRDTFIRKISDSSISKIRVSLRKPITPTIPSMRASKRTHSCGHLDAIAIAKRSYSENAESVFASPLTNITEQTAALLMSVSSESLGRNRLQGIKLNENFHLSDHQLITVREMFNRERLKGRNEPGHSILAYFILCYPQVVPVFGTEESSTFFDHSVRLTQALTQIMKNLNCWQRIESLLKKSGSMHAQCLAQMKGFQPNYWDYLAESLIQETLRWASNPTEKSLPTRHAWMKIAWHLVEDLKSGYNEEMQANPGQNNSDSDSSEAG